MRKSCNRYDRVDVYALGGMVESPSDGHALIFTKGWHPTAETFTYMKYVFKRWHGRQPYQAGRGGGKNSSRDRRENHFHVAHVLVHV